MGVRKENMQCEGGGGKREAAHVWMDVTKSYTAAECAKRWLCRIAGYAMMQPSNTTWMHPMPPAEQKYGISTLITPLDHTARAASAAIAGCRYSRATPRLLKLSKRR